MNVARWVVVGLLMAGCSQAPAGQASASPTPPSPSTTSSASGALSTPTPALSTPTPASPSPIAASGSYATATEAGIAGIEAKTGNAYSGAACSGSETCLGAPQVFGNTGAGGYDAAYVQMAFAPAGAGSCFAYVYFEAGFWHYTPPVVCPNRSGYNP